MISIFIFHSPDRINALRATISCLEEMEFYEKCQKTLIVDEKTDYIPLNFDLVCVPRVNNRFNWARMWDAGVLTSKHPISLYLDSDRLLPKNYLSLILENIREDSFLFTSRHFMMMREIGLDECKDFLQKAQEDLFKDTKYFGKLRFESRFKEPVTGPGKNVMSGNTAFYKLAYLKIGGVDSWYEGHGAFADTDFHLKAANCGYRFIDLKSTEIHYVHKKLENNNALTDDELHKLSLDNYIYFCKKWSLPKVLAEDMAYKIKMDNPKDYVNVKWNEIG